MQKVANKLVRDNIPDIIRSQGGECNIRLMENNEYRQELIKKMHEEVNEFDKENNVEELADIFEVFLALVKLSSLNPSDVIRIANEKRNRNGSFDHRIYMMDYTDNRIINDWNAVFVIVFHTYYKHFHMANTYVLKE